MTRGKPILLVETAQRRSVGRAGVKAQFFEDALCMYGIAAVLQPVD